MQNSKILSSITYEVGPIHTFWLAETFCEVFALGPYHYGIILPCLYFFCL